MHIVGNWHGAAEGICVYVVAGSAARPIASVGFPSHTMSQFFHSIASKQTDQRCWTQICREHRKCCYGTSRGFLCFSLVCLIKVSLCLGLITQVGMMTYSLGRFVGKLSALKRKSWCSSDIARCSSYGSVLSGQLGGCSRCYDLA